MRSIRNNGEALRPASMLQKRANGSDLFRKRLFSGVRKNIECKFAVGSQRTAHNHRKTSAIKFSSDLALETGKMITKVHHAAVGAKLRKPRKLITMLSRRFGIAESRLNVRTPVTLEKSV